MTPGGTRRWSVSGAGGHAVSASEARCKGTRASFTSAAPPDEGARFFDYLVGQAYARHSIVATGRFGAEMQVALVNDGPVTFWLET